MVTAYRAAAMVPDPELPQLTLADLGILRDVSESGGRVVVTITPTYTGCPALEAIRDDIVRALEQAGYPDAEIRTVLQPAWSSDWITPDGGRKLARAGIAPPGPAAPRRSGPVPLALVPPASLVRCPRCGSAATELLSQFGSTACKSLHRCHACQEPFEHVKEI